MSCVVLVTQKSPIDLETVFKDNVQYIPAVDGRQLDGRLIMDTILINADKYAVCLLEDSTFHTDTVTVIFREYGDDETPAVVGMLQSVINLTGTVESSVYRLNEGAGWTFELKGGEGSAPIRKLLQERRREAMSKGSFLTQVNTSNG